MYNKQWKIIGYIVLVVMVMVMSWEQVYSQPLLWNNQELPKDAIRLRVLPNSDRPVDQWLKLRVRDAVTEKMQEWTVMLENRAQAEAMIGRRIVEIEQLVKETLAEEGFQYPVKVSFGNTEFPTVQYGEHMFPAGEYQAVLIEIGEAQGKNWWCVLYPPLCLVDIVSATVVEDAGEEVSDQDAAVSDEAVSEALKTDNEVEVETDNEVEVEGTSQEQVNNQSVEVRFFLGELFNR